MIGPDVEARLQDEVVIWLTTVTPSCRPQTSLVWFLWEAGEFVVYSLADTARVRNLSTHPHVSLNLDSDGVGGGVVTIEAIARVDPGAAPAYQVPEYVAKYRQHMERLGWTPEEFSERYPVAIRITPKRVRAW